MYISIHTNIVIVSGTITLKNKNKILLFIILALVSNLTVIKHHHPRSKYPTHDSGVQWQPQVHLPVTPQGRLQKIPHDYSIHSSEYLSAILRLVGGESEEGYNLRFNWNDLKHWVVLHWYVWGVSILEGN